MSKKKNRDNWKLRKKIVKRIAAYEREKVSIVHAKDRTDISEALINDYNTRLNYINLVMYELAYLLQFADEICHIV